MGSLWSEEKKFSTWLEIETVVCEEMEALGLCPEGTAGKIREKGRFTGNVHSFPAQAAQYLPIYCPVSCLQRLLRGNQIRFAHRAFNESFDEELRSCCEAFGEFEA